MPSDNPELRKFERSGKAILAGASTTALLIFLTLATPTLLTQRASGGEKVRIALSDGLCSAIGGGLIGIIAGVIGASVRNSSRAAWISGLVFVGVAGLALLTSAITQETFEPIREKVWFLVAACAVGALSGGMGAVAARTAGGNDEESQPLRFSLRELFALCLLLTVVFAYAGHLIRR